MQITDRYTKVVLTLLTLGVWGLLLRPLLAENPAWAQKKPSTEKKAAAAAVKPSGKTEYGVLVPEEGKGFVVNGAGPVALTATGLENGLDSISGGEWKLHSVVYNTVMGGYTIIVQK